MQIRNSASCEAADVIRQLPAGAISRARSSHEENFGNEITTYILESNLAFEREDALVYCTCSHRPLEGLPFPSVYYKLYRKAHQNIQATAKRPLVAPVRCKRVSYKDVK